MALRLTNSLGGKLEEFEPLEPRKVRMYHCGPTVKEPIHIGKFRSYLLGDVLRRHLDRSGFEVHQVMNITDVGHLNEFEEDVVEVAAGRVGLYAWELAENEVRIFQEDRRALGILGAHEYPKAREHVDDMVATIRDLERAGACYQAGGNLYLDVTRDPGFGRLSLRTRQELAELQKSSRTAGQPHKRHPLDIDLWRTDALHQMHWDSPWGRGFPGWHVECVAMSRKYLGPFFDIHTGSHDNVFPHHECEMAQAAVLGACGDGGTPLARWWLHTGPVKVEGKPMETLNRNVVSVRELLKEGFRGRVVRVALLGTHYRAELDFGESVLDRAREAVNVVLGFRDEIREAASREAGATRRGVRPQRWVEDTSERFEAALDADLDYGGALDAVLDAIRTLEPGSVGSPRAALDALGDWDRVLGIL
jgi:cysteinyl-tRNA synthetase